MPLGHLPPSPPIGEGQVLALKGLLMPSSSGGLREGNCELFLGVFVSPPPPVPVEAEGLSSVPALFLPTSGAASRDVHRRQTSSAAAASPHACPAPPPLPARAAPVFFVALSLPAKTAVGTTALG